ncbi:MAG: 4-deoxy-4-formamido-L-arabinose-phosphoundecaprenol deformylase [Bdellovibrionaceae bacterium]|nr:4-deoxy-4-formamido-L-arabinose-phosphoundecaprenol deformylase [Pseudobdellovibrionaceae bacterium]
MRTIVLKIDVDTYRGTREGVPPLIDLFQKHNAQATFLFSLGPDHTGWALRRIFRPGFFSKVQRTSVVSHYGIKTLLYGVLLPAPHIGRQAQTYIQQVAQTGFEVGIHCYDHVYWQDNVMNRSVEWTQEQMNKSADEFKRIFSRDAQTHGAAGWQMNEAGFRWLERFLYSSDTRGQTPFYPLNADNTVSTCMQLPTTLPTMDELLGQNGVDENTIDQALLKLTEKESEWGHVYTLHAELEGMKLLPAFDRFLAGLRSQGYEFLSMGDYYQRVKSKNIPSAKIAYGTLAGRSGSLCLQQN